MAPSRMQILMAWARLPHFVPLMAVLVATAAFALVAAGGWPGAGLLLRLLGAMLGAQIVIGVVNDLVDVEVDSVAKPHKPIPSGLVTYWGAVTVGAAGLVLMVALGSTFGATSLAICALGMATGAAYSLWFKRTIWSWVPYLIALPLAPIWVWVTIDSLPWQMLAVYPIGAAAVVSVHLAQSLPDIEGDRATGVHTLAVRLGDDHARLICWGAMTVAAASMAIAAPWIVEYPVRAWLAAVLCTMLVGVNWLIWRRNPNEGAWLSFPLMAAATIVLAIGWTTSISSG